MTVFTNEMKETLSQMYAAGCLFREIAEDLGMSETNVRSKASRLGLCNRRGPYRPYREIALGESELGLTRKQVDNWASHGRHDGVRFKRFRKNGMLGLRRIA